MLNVWRESRMLSQLLHPFRSDDFVAGYFHKEFLRVEGHSRKFEDLVNWSELNAAIRNHSLQMPYIRVVQDGADIPVEAYTRAVLHRGRSVLEISGPELVSKLSEGATLVIDQVDRVFDPVATL